MGANSFPYEMTPIYMGGNNETDRVASPASVPVQLKRRFDGDNIGTVILAIKACMYAIMDPAPLPKLCYYIHQSNLS